MISLFVVLFFSITGVTLNHPNWAFGSAGGRSTVEGKLPDTWITSSGTVDWMIVTEHLRSEHGVHGSVTERSANEQDASITFKGPSYQADTFITVDTSAYELTVETQGFLALVNDLHKGRDTPTSWRWLIDVSGIFLTIVSITGITLQFFLKKRRRSALITSVVGVVLLGIMTWLAIQ
jgi:uncharacterized protein